MGRLHIGNNEGVPAIVTFKKGDYHVLVVDYDGTTITQDYLDTGYTFTLPTPPVHEGLIFKEWSCAFPIVNNEIVVTDSDIIIGPIYETLSGKTEFDIDIPKSFPLLTITLNTDVEKNWGDGTVDSLTSHTYANYGQYTIKCDLTRIEEEFFNSGYNSIILKEIRFGKNLTYLKNAFQNSEVLEAVSFPQGLTIIDEYSFDFCRHIKNLIFPSSLTNIGEYAFQANVILANCVFSKNLQTIDNNCFYQCHSLKKAILPNSLISLGNATFDGNKNLSNVHLSNQLLELPENCFSSCYTLKAMKIPEGIITINRQCFSKCSGLNTIILPQSLSSIAFRAFDHCSVLKEITLPDNLTTIASKVFEATVSLSKIVFGSGLTKIETNAFYGQNTCLLYDFTNVLTVPELEIEAFDPSMNLQTKIAVPQTLLSSWKTAPNWSDYADYIYGV